MKVMECTVVLALVAAAAAQFASFKPATTLAQHPAFGAPGFKAPAFGAPAFVAPAFAAPAFAAPAFAAPAFAAPAVGAPAFPTKFIPVLSRTDIRDDAGQISHSYQSGDGTSVSEQGVLKMNKEGDGHVLVKQGSYSYTSPDGTPITLTYVADENGFQPTGAHLPASVQPLAPTF